MSLKPGSGTQTAHQSEAGCRSEGGCRCRRRRHSRRRQSVPAAGARLSLHHVKKGKKFIVHLKLSVGGGRSSPCAVQAGIGLARCLSSVRARAMARCASAYCLPSRGEGCCANMHTWDAKLRHICARCPVRLQHIARVKRHVPAVASVTPAELASSQQATSATADACRQAAMSFSRGVSRLLITGKFSLQMNQMTAAHIDGSNGCLPFFLLQLYSSKSCPLGPNR